MKALMLNSEYFPTAFSSFSEKLLFAKQRNDALERFRLERVLANSDVAFQQVFALLPVILHTNSPDLPAYVENAPQGIFHFHYRDFQKCYFEQLPTEPETAVFDGLYAMGSIGTITQTRFSDLDVWLVHSQPFSEDELSRLHLKLEAIKQWAASLGVEISLFLMNPHTFQAQQYQNATDEHNGSAQHFFLLDEFYRSAIRLAGKRILWLHIDKQGQDYQTLLAQAVENGELNAKEWVDFGDFSSLSVGEFLGASLWQLYKGIQNPHKSLIKILLLESYAETYPKTDLISKQFKKRLLSPEPINYHFDPYLAMLDQVTAYLNEAEEAERLLCLRRCFYLKACNGQMNEVHHNELLELATAWGWQSDEIERLNCRREWKVKQAAAHSQMLVEQLLQSYCYLRNFANKFANDPSIMPQDTDFLMRQLYSAFEHVPGKIALINRHARYDLAESDLTFFEVADNVSVDAGWYMLNHPPFSAYDASRRYVMYKPNLIEAVAWAYFNGLITAETTIHLVNQRIEVARLRRFITDLRLSFPVRPPKLAREDLNHPNEIRNLIVAINLLDDPTGELPLLSKAEIGQIDLFNLSSSGRGVIGSISIIYRNMWNEVMTQHFEGSDSLLKSLKFISNKIYRSSAPPESVNVYCYSKQMKNELEQFVLNLVNRCITVKTGSIFQRVQPQIVQVAGRKWHLVFNKQQELKEILEEFDPLSSTEIHSIPVEIYAFASEGFLQFFFVDNDDGTFNVYVLDKQNQAECYCYCCGEKENKIREICRLYTELPQGESSVVSGSFDFPQFYQLLPIENSMVIVPFQSKQHREFLEKQSSKDTKCQQLILN